MSSTSGRMQGNNVTIGGRTGNFFFIDWSLSSQNPSGNTSNISWAAYFYYDQADAQLDDGDASLGGVLRWDVPGRVRNYGGVFTARSVLLASGSFTVTHDNAGNFTLNVNGSIGGSLSARSSGNANWALPGFNRTANPPTIASSSRDGAGTTATIVSNVASVNNNGPAVTDYNYQWSTNNVNWSGDLAMGTGRTASLSVGKTTRYWFRARAFNSAGGWTAYGASAGPFAGFPTAPRSLIVTPSSSISGRINLSWTEPENANVSSVVGYRVYRKLSTDSTYTLVTTGSTGIQTLSYIDEGLSRGALYDYYVTAVNLVSLTGGGGAAFTGESDASNTVSNIRAPGSPTAPTLQSAVASTSVFGRVDLTWTVPTNTAGGVIDYYLYADNVLVASVTGQNTLTGGVTGLNPRQTYSFTVRARNQYAIDNGTTGDASNAISRKSPGPPTAPTSLVSEAPFFPPGTIDLDWVAPSDVGTEGGTITGYSIYLAGGTVPIKTITGTGTSTTIEDLIPATSYTFFVRARNEIADTVGTFSANSNSTTATAQGEPDAPTGLTVVSDPLVAGRLILTWVPPVGYNTGFRVYTGAGALIANISTPRLEIDGLAPNTSFSYKVRARNPLTDLTNSEGGPFSATAAGTTGGSSSQTIPNISVANSTNSTFVGTYSLVGTTATTISYSKTASNINFATVPTSGGTTLNNTNTNLNGTYTIGVSDPTSVTYTKAGSDIAVNTSTPSGTMTNNTNVIFNGSYEVLAIPAPDPVTKTISYSKISSDISTRAASGTITNNSNAVYNGEHVIEEVTETTLIYDRESEDIEESDAFGTVIDKTNQSIFNGTFTLSDTPDHKTVEYSTGDFTFSENLITNPSMRTVTSGTTVQRTNLITNPSFETNVTSWSGASASISRNGTQAYSGNYSGYVTLSSTSGGVTTPVATVSGQPYTLSMYVYSSERTSVRLTVNSPATTGTTVELAKDTWTRLVLTFTANTTTTTVGIQSVDSSQPFYVDAVQVENVGHIRPYFDGTTLDEFGWEFDWSGTAHASISVAKAAAEVDVVGYSPIPVDTTNITYDCSLFRTGCNSQIVLPTIIPSVRNDQQFLNNIGTGPNSRVSLVKAQGDGSVYVGGSFTSWNGVSSIIALVRLDPSGNRDTAFSANVGSGGGLGSFGPRDMALQSDEKIILVGGIPTWNSATVNNILRLNPNGTRDTAFTTNTGAGADQRPQAVDIQSDGKILVGGRFTLWNGVSAPYLVRLNADGTADTAYNSNLGTGFNSIVRDVTVQPDGKTIVVGEFTEFNGTTARRVVRLNSDGSLDTAFMANIGTGASGYITTATLYPDGRIILAGNFTSFGSVAYTSGIVRLSSDGVLDTTFSNNMSPGLNQGFSSSIEAAVIQSDGKIVVGGLFTSWGSTTVNRVARINPDGTKDTTFNSAIGTAANSPVFDLDILPNQKIIFGGDFTSWNGLTARLMQIEPYQVGIIGGVSTTVSVSSGTTYTFSGWVFSGEPIDVVVSATNPTTDSPVFTVPSGVWTRVFLTFTANSTTTVLSIVSSQTTGFNVDDFMLQESDVLEAYFDGSTGEEVDSWPIEYSWSGTPHASISVREVGATLPEVGAAILAPFGEASRLQSDAQLQIRYRSGWLG